MIVAILIGLLLVTAACGDLQDPVTGGSVPFTHLAEQPAADPASSSGVQGHSEKNQEQSHEETSSGSQEAGGTTSEQNQGQSLQTTSQVPMKSVTLGWDPSASQDVLGYKVHLFTVSSSLKEIIDVGSKTELALPLKIGESYGFTVTAYNAGIESEALPYLMFQAF